VRVKRPAVIPVPSYLLRIYNHIIVLTMIILLMQLRGKLKDAIGIGLGRRMRRTWRGCPTVHSVMAPVMDAHLALYALVASVPSAFLSFSKKNSF
jgi:hypothetical protein